MNTMRVEALVDGILYSDHDLARISPTRRARLLTGRNRDHINERNGRSRSNLNDGNIPGPSGDGPSGVT